MANSLYPAFVKIDYHSAQGAHVMIIPTLEWHANDILVAGEFESWNAGLVDADDKINDLVDLFLPFFLATTTFDFYTIYTMASPTAAAQPVAAASLAKVGTSVSTTWAKAVQKTLIMRTTDFGIMKLVFLDCPSGNNFDPVNAYGVDPATTAIINELKNEDSPWSARDNGRPNTLIKQTTTLNEKLRKEYNMA